MQKLGEGEGTMSKEEFAKMKQELEVDCLAVCKKIVPSHEIFLQWLSSRPVLNEDGTVMFSWNSIRIRVLGTKIPRDVWWLFQKCAEKC